MKLPTTITGGDASHLRRPHESRHGPGAAGEQASHFDDVLSDVRTGASTKASRPAGISQKPAFAAGGAVDPGSGAKTALDALAIGPTLFGQCPTGAPTRSSTEDATGAGSHVSGQDDEATPAPTTDGQPPQTLLEAFLFAAPSAGRQDEAVQSTAIVGASPTSAAAASDMTADLAGSASPSVPRNGATPLVSDISVLSQPAPVTRPSDIALAGMAQTRSEAVAQDAGSAPRATPFPHPGPPATDTSFADRAPAKGVEAGTHDGSPNGSSPELAKRTARDASADATPKDDAPLPLAGASPALQQTPANALSTLSPPVRQVADTLARLAADAAAPGGAPVPEIATARPALARTLTLQISPADHGTVAIRMHATGGSLDVQLTASDPRTAGLLARERDALAATLQDGRTALHSLVIQDGSGAPQPGGHHATRGDSSGAGARDQRQGSDAGGSGNGNQRRDQAESRPRREDGTGGGELASGGSRSLLV